MDYRDHKPHLNVALYSLWISGVGLRQSARELRITLRNVQNKFVKIGRHLRDMHHNLMRPIEREASFAFDEAQTFEGCRDTRPLTVPFVIEQSSFFLVDARCGPIPPSGGMSVRRRRAIEREREVNGPRPNASRAVVGAALARAAALVPDHATVHVRSDLKSTYAKLVREAFGAARVLHQQVSSRLPRNTKNPLHRINLMLAVARDLMSRLRRRSWLISKLAARLDLHLAMFACYRNYVRPRFNGERDSPAQRLGLLRRRLTKQELLSWRQDWRVERCIGPLEPAIAEVVEPIAG